MLDHAFEEYDEMLEREVRDDLAVWASFFNARGDDRLEPCPWDVCVPETEFVPGLATTSAPRSSALDGAGARATEREAA
jgi:hypothetical protein